MSRSVAAWRAQGALPQTDRPLAGLRRWMEGRRLDALYITRPVSIAYLTGFSANPHERLMGLAVGAEGATLIVPALEAQKAEEHATDAGVVSWRDGEDPYALVAQALAGLTELGVEKDHLSLQGAEVITSRTGISQLVDVGAEIKRRRLHKNEEEIAWLQRAADITDTAGEKVISSLRVGQSEIEVAQAVASAIGDLGGTLSFPTLVQSGPNSTMPHLEPSSRKLAQGDLVLLDFGAAFANYNADSTRMAVVGEPSPKHREIHELVLAAHDAAMAVVRAGATTGDVDAAARKVIDAAGYGGQFFHRIGHGLGLEVMKTRASILALARCSRRAWSSPSSPVSTSLAGAEFGSKTTLSLKKAGVAC